MAYVTLRLLEVTKKVLRGGGRYDRDDLDLSLSFSDDICIDLSVPRFLIGVEFYAEESLWPHTARPFVFNEQPYLMVFGQMLQRAAYWKNDDPRSELLWRVKKLLGAGRRDFNLATSNLPQKSGGTSPVLRGTRMMTWWVPF